LISTPNKSCTAEQKVQNEECNLEFRLQTEDKFPVRDLKLTQTGSNIVDCCWQIFAGTRSKWVKFQYRWCTIEIIRRQVADEELKMSISFELSSEKVVYSSWLRWLNGQSLHDKNWSLSQIDAWLSWNYPYISF